MAAAPDPYSYSLTSAGRKVLNSARPTIHVTVAAVVQDARGRFLIVEERVAGRLVLNQPAGHLEPDETLVAAAVRETLEETGWRFEPEGLVGVYRWASPSGRVYLRTTFFGRPAGHVHDALDEGIVAARWLSAADLRAAVHRHRSPLVWRCVRDYLDGQRYPLNFLADLSDG
jgi:8-oxo-dGTP pyrophosphatase MutT (NUDIX family)